MLTTTHVSFTVADLERSLAFYQGILGFELVGIMDRATEDLARVTSFPGVHLKTAYLRLPHPGELFLELIEYVSPRGEPIDSRTCNPGVGHICFKVDDIRSTYADWRSKGVRFKSEPVEIVSGINRGAYALYFLDPDGITLELVQPAPG